MKRAIRFITLWSLCLTLACADEGGSTLDVNFEKYELDNGLDVVLHVDRSDPVVAVVMMFHVGSAREVEGRTGLAHLFEHLFFGDLLGFTRSFFSFFVLLLHLLVVKWANILQYSYYILILLHNLNLNLNFEGPS